MGEKDWFLIAKIQKTAHPHKQKPDKLEKLDVLEGLEGQRARARMGGRAREPLDRRASGAGGAGAKIKAVI